MHEKIMILRKELRLTRAAFGERLGVSGDVINSWERGRVTPPEIAIKAICREFNVNESWLREGKGDIFAPPDGFSLAGFVQQNGGTVLEFKLLQAYFDLPEDFRRNLLEHFRNSLASSNGSAPPTKEDIRDALKSYAEARNISLSKITQDALKKRLVHA